MDAYYHGAYRGVPFKIGYDDFNEWDMVDPANCLSYDGVFLGYGLQMGGTYAHINYGDKQVDFAEGAYDALISDRHDKIARKMKKELGKEAWAEKIGWYANNDNPAAAMIDHDISEALREKDTDTLVKYLKYAGVDYVQEDLRGDTQSSFCSTLFFKKDGSKITKPERKEYLGQLKEINNWLWGNVYEVSLPLEHCSGFVDDPSPEHDENSGPLCFAQEQIDLLLKPTSGKYLVTADTAVAVTTGHRTKVEYNPNKPVKIYVDSLEDAKKVSGWFEGNAIITENSKKKDRGR